MAILTQTTSADAETLPKPADVAGALLAELAHIGQQIESLQERRTKLVTGSAALLVEAGVEHYVVEQSKYSEAPAVGTRGVIWLEWWGHQHRVTRRFNGLPVVDDRRGPEASGCQSIIWGVVGVFEVVASDAESLLVVRVYDDEWEEVGHRKAVARLRNRARAGGMRVSVRDRTVSIVDPMGTVTHVGDVWSAWFWLEGVDYEEVA